MNKILLLMAAMMWSAAFGVSARHRTSDISPAALRVENRIDPSVIESSRPRMSWINEVRDSTVRGAAQSAYRILVASSRAALDRNSGDMWDSGRVRSADSYLVDYAGDSLLPGRDYWWKVQVWDGKGRRSAWSRSARFGTGLAQNGWTARWIGAPWQGEEASRDYGQAPVFSKTFEADTAGLVSAKAFVTGLGYFELELNGNRVGDDLFVPNVTNYGPRPGLEKARLPMADNYAASRVLYLAYDIKDGLINGANTLCATVGNGFYNSHETWVEAYGSPRFLCQIRLEYAGGRSVTVVTDETWMASRSPIVSNDVYRGEVYDANVEARPEPVVLRRAPEGVLTAQTSPADRVLRTIRPVSAVSNDDGSVTFGFGEEVTGRIRLSGMNGRKGDVVTVRYIYDYGLPVGSTRDQDYRYVMDGSGGESCAPRFLWYTFHTVTVAGLDSVAADNVVAEVIGTDVPVDAGFRSSDPLLDRIVDMWLRTQTDNMHGGLPSDCPQREKNAYTGDGQVAAAMVMANYDAAAFYEKWMRDIRDAQHDDGYIPNSAPWQPGCGGGVPWGAAISVIPWEYYLNYGDTGALADNYDAMKRYTDYMTLWLTPDSTMFQQMPLLGKGDPFYWFNLGEWGLRGKLPREELVHTFYTWMCADITAASARVLGHEEDAMGYDRLANGIREAFHRKFYDADKQSYGDYGSNVFALVMGVPDSVKAGVVASLRRTIETDCDSHLDTGIFGTRYLFGVLARNGMADLAYKVMTRRTHPGFGYWAECGSTTMWEFWNGYGSHNHPMFGGGLVWLYRDLAGINCDPRNPGYRHVIVRPVPVDGLEQVSYSKITPYGTVSSTVTNKPGVRSVRLTIPVGTTATVSLPGHDTPLHLTQGTYHLPF